MRIGSRVLCCLCASVMLVCSCVAVTAEENTSASQALIERAVMSYAAYGEQDAQAMEALAADDPALAEKCEAILRALPETEA